MTLVSSIINRAYREANLIPLVSTPSANQITEAVEHLNPIILSSVGNEIGSELLDLNYDGESRFDQADYVNEWVEDNIRLVLNLDAAATVALDPRPYEGQRFAIVDAANSLDTYNLTIDPNGRKIEDALTLTLSTEGINRQWLYRADTANWVRINELTSSDSMPFPVEFDPYFIIMLAGRLNPAYGQAMDPQTSRMLERARSQLRARYCRKEYNSPCDPGLVDPRERQYGTSMTPFNIGRPYPRF